MGANEQGADATDGRWLTMPRTLSFVLNGDAVLLMKRGSHKRVFPNQYNGLGGHIERNEDPASGALREIREESGLTVHDLRLRSVHNIDSGARSGITLFVYTARSRSRDVRADCPEGELEWVALDEILERDLVEDLPLLLPRVLAMADDAPPLHAHASYDAADNLVLHFREDG